MPTHRINHIYTDGSWDSTTQLGAYCIVIVEPGKDPDWILAPVDARSSEDVEALGICEALKLAQKLAAQNHCPSSVWCDSKSAIKRSRSLLVNKKHIQLQYIKAHTLASMDNTVRVTDHLKRQHWADVMARGLTKERIKRIAALQNKHERDKIIE
jgi:ribonuclease HI